MHAREERLNAITIRNGFGYQEQENSAYLLDDEGERIARLSSVFVAVVADVTDDDAEAILCQLHNVHLNSQGRGYRNGQRVGRQSIVSVVHELLGVDRIAAALEEAATRSR